MSEKIAEAPHEPCILSTVVCARATCGAATVAAPAPAATVAPFRNLRRETDLSWDLVISFLQHVSFWTGMA